MKTKKQIFIGGTGRSGTSILGHIFHEHPRVYYFSEPYFLKGRGLLVDFIRGNIAYEAFRENMVGSVREIIIQKLLSYGYSNAAVLYAKEKVCQMLDDAFTRGGDPIVNARRFLDAFFYLPLASGDYDYFVEKTPHNILIADVLFDIFPHMNYIHIIRDPKDVCCSILQQQWGPTTVIDFIPYWNRIMQEAYHVQKRIPLDNYCVVSLESFFEKESRTLESILRFVAIEYDNALLMKWRTMLKAEKAHCGRWKHELSPDEAALIDTQCTVYHQWKERERASREYFLSHACP